MGILPLRGARLLCLLASIDEFRFRFIHF